MRHRKRVRTVVAIDVGHGGRDPGASGLRGRLREKQVTLSVGLLLAQELHRRGYRVHLSRASDRSLPPSRRRRWLARTSGSLLVSLHCDACPNSSRVRGVTTYFHPRSRRSRLLARAVQRSLVRTARTVNFGIRPDTVRYRGGFYILREARRPAALVELGYLSHRPTAQKMAQRSYRKRLAQAVARGVALYLKGVAHA